MLPNCQWPFSVVSELLLLILTRCWWFPCSFAERNKLGTYHRIAWTPTLHILKRCVKIWPSWNSMKDYHSLKLSCQILQLLIHVLLKVFSFRWWRSHLISRFMPLKDRHPKNASRCRPLLATSSMVFWHFACYFCRWQRHTPLLLNLSYRALLRSSRNKKLHPFVCETAAIKALELREECIHLSIMATVVEHWRQSPGGDRQEIPHTWLRVSLGRNWFGRSAKHFTQLL